MSQPIDKATVVNRALVKIGQEPVFSLDAEEFINGQVDALWPECVDLCFSLHDWSFCRRTLRLTRLESQPQNGFLHAFVLPGDRLGEPLKVLSAVAHGDTVLRDFTIEGAELYANVPDVWARCKVAVDPSFWDGGFRSAFITALASMLAIPVAEDAGLEEQYRTQAFGTPSQGGVGGMFGRLIAQNRSGSPIGSPFMRGDPLTDARHM